MKLISRATKLLCVLALLAGCGPNQTGPEPKAKPAAKPKVKPKTKPDAKSGDTPKKGPTSKKPPKADPPEKVTASKESVVKVKRLLRRWASTVDVEREEAWQGLKDMGDLATPALIEVVKAGKPEQRRLAIVAIGLLRDKLGAVALRGALSDKSANTRWKAARALGEIGDEGAKESLAKAVKDDKDPEVRYYAAYALASLGGKEAFEFFKVLLKSEKPVDRSRAVRALGKYGEGKYVSELIAAMQDKDARVRRATVIQLDRSRHKDAVPGLIAALADKDYRVRKRARSALERLTKKDFGANKPKWEEWWKKDGKAFKVPTGSKAKVKPKAHKWANATALKGEGDFKKKVEGAKGWVLVIFYTVRSRDCARQAPIFDKLAKEYKGKVAMYEAESRANIKTIRGLKLRKAPSMVVYKDGKKLEVLAGFQDEAAFKKFIDEHLAGTRKVAVQKAPGKPKKTFPDATKDADFEKMVTNAKGLVLVDFHADWCGWCHKLTPTLNKLSAAYQGKIAFVGVDSDKNKPLMKKFGVRGLPTLIVFKDGKKAETIVGYKPEAALKAILEKHLKAGGAK